MHVFEIRTLFFVHVLQDRKVEETIDENQGVAACETSDLRVCPDPPDKTFHASVHNRIKY
jgi:hypothetical protein